MGKVEVVGFHGDFAAVFGNGGDKLRRDAGNPQWLGYCPNWKRHKRRGTTNLLLESLRFAPFIGVGFSKGGSFTAELTHYLGNMVGAVLYESPMLTVDAPRCNFPVLWIQNRNSLYKNTREMEDTKRQWASRASSFTELWGNGRHMRWFPPGHGWDRSLNPLIHSWIKSIS